MLLTGEMKAGAGIVHVSGAGTSETHPRVPSRRRRCIVPAELIYVGRRWAIRMSRQGPHECLDPRVRAGATTASSRDSDQAPGGEEMPSPRVGGIGRLKRAEMILAGPFPTSRSEERRVGKECRSRWSPYH